MKQKRATSTADTIQTIISTPRFASSHIAVLQAQIARGTFSTEDYVLFQSRIKDAVLSLEREIERLHDSAATIQRTRLYVKYKQPKNSWEA